VSPKFAQKILDEMRNSRDKPLEDPDLKWEERIIKWKKHIDPHEVLDDSDFFFLLSLHAEDPRQQNADYVKALLDVKGKVVTECFI